MLLTWMSMNSKQRPPFYDHQKINELYGLVFVRFFITLFLFFYVFWVPQFHLSDYLFLGLVVFQLLLYIYSPSAYPFNVMENELMLGITQDNGELFIEYLDNQPLEFIISLIGLVSNFTIGFVLFRVLVRFGISHTLSCVFASLFVLTRAYLLAGFKPTFPQHI
jgi:hypothetical protein